MIIADHDLSCSLAVTDYSMILSFTPVFLHEFRDNSQKSVCAPRDGLELRSIGLCKANSRYLLS